MATPETTNGPMGIRTGLWLAVCGLAALCLLIIMFSQRHPRPSDQITPDSYPATRHDASLETQARPRRATSDREEFGDRWEGSIPATLTAVEAATLACSLANARAKELYGCEPFRDPPPARWDDAGWVWTDCRARGRDDIEATVHLAPDGSPRNLEVIVLLLDFLR